MTGQRRFVCSVRDGSNDEGRRGTAAYEFIKITAKDKGDVMVGF